MCTAPGASTKPLQLCLRSDVDLPGLRVIVKPRPGYRALPKSMFHFFEVCYVPTPKDPVHKWWPDPLAPLGPNHRVFDVKGGETKEVWCQVHIADDPPAPGEYRMDVEVWDTELPHETGIAHHRLFSAPMSVWVWPFHMPRTNHLRTGFGTWTSMMAPKFGVHLQSRQLRALKTQVYYELLNHRICASELPFDRVRPAVRAPDGDAQRERVLDADGAGGQAGNAGDQVGARRATRSAEEGVCPSVG